MWGFSCELGFDTKNPPARTLLRVSGYHTRTPTTAFCQSYRSIQLCDKTSFWKRFKLVIMSSWISNTLGQTRIIKILICIVKLNREYTPLIRVIMYWKNDWNQNSSSDNWKNACTLVFYVQFCPVPVRN